MTPVADFAQVTIMLLLDSLLRFSAITMLLLTGAVVLRDTKQLLQARLAAALCISLAAMLLNTLPSVYNIPRPMAAMTWLLHVPNIVLLWLFGLSLFEDDFRLSKLHWATLIGVTAAMSVVQFAVLTGWDEALVVGIVFNRIIGFTVLSHLMWTALSGRRDDLVEARRRVRLWFTLGVAVTALLIISGETVQFAMTLEAQDPDSLTTLRTAVAWPMILFGSLWFLQARAENFKFETVAPVAAPKLSIDPKDAASHRELVAAIEAGVYLQPGLTISDLSDQIKVPEHQLRNLINKGLGYRNFAAFLNGYRIEFAKKRLADPKHARMPVLTIAMDAGFNSLAPFNRAFRSVEGITPTAYRAKVLKEVSRQAKLSDDEKA